MSAPTRALLGAAAGIAVVTVAARVVGFGRVAVLSRTLGTSTVGDVYQAVNAVPNVVFEVVAGGALASVVVPVLAGAVVAGDRAAVSRTASALLTWAVLVLTPFAVVGALAAPVLVRALLGPGADPDAVALGARMLVVFMPQVVLYGVGLVLAGVLQAHSRFLGPALAPLLSSIVVISAYLLYAAQGTTARVERLTTSQELTLSVGTTLGVAVLSLSLLVPLRRCGVRLRPGLRFPPGVARRARGLATAGLAGLAAQQVALVVALRLAAEPEDGSVVVFTVATALFLLPWAVLAVPVATSAFPRLAAAAQDGDEPAYAGVVSGALRAVLLLALASAALLVVVAVPVARLLVEGVPGETSTGALARAVVAFAPGLVGYGLVALLARALYARGEGRRAATAVVAGWLAVVAADLALVGALPQVERVVLLGAGNTVGMTVAGAWLVVALRRAAGPAPLSGAGRAGAAGVLGAVLAVAVAALLPSAHSPALPGALALGTAGAVLAGAVFLAVVRLVDPAALRGLRRG